MSQEEAVTLLDCHYRAEVWRRHDEFRESKAYNQMIEEFAKALTDEKGKHFGIYVCGICGNGKTTLLRAFRSAVADLDKTFNAFADDMKKTCKRYDVMLYQARQINEIAKRDRDTFDKLMDCNILCIDDCGIEPADVMSFGNVMSPVQELIEYRYEKQLFTVLSTNLRASEFADKYGQRVKSRKDDMMIKIIVESESYRKA